jgi:hypothetical protein
MEITTDYNKEWDFSTYQTYDWVAAKSPTLRDPLIETNLLDTRVKRAVEGELSLKGYRQTTEDPDFLISYHVGQQSQVDVSTCGYHYPTTPHCWGREIDTYAYSKGTLVLDFIDAGKEELVWRASGSSAIHDPEEGEEIMRDAIKKMLKAFPPG